MKHLKVNIRLSFNVVFRNKENTTTDTLSVNGRNSIERAEIHAINILEIRYFYFIPVALLT